MLSNSFPTKDERRAVIQSALVRNGIPEPAAKKISWYVPDFLTLHSVFVEPENLTLEILETGACYLRCRDKLIYIGFYHWNLDCGIRAGHRWTEMDIASLCDESQAQLNVDELLSQVNPKSWRTEQSWYSKVKSKLKLELNTLLTDKFIGVAYETIH